MRKNQEKNTPDKRVSAEVSNDDKKAVEQPQKRPIRIVVLPPKQKTDKSKKNVKTE